VLDARAGGVGKGRWRLAIAVEGWWMLSPGGDLLAGDWRCWRGFGPGAKRRFSRRDEEPVGGGRGVEPGLEGGWSVPGTGVLIDLVKAEGVESATASRDLGCL